jgi:hypothetical protein
MTDLKTARLVWIAAMTYGTESEFDRARGIYLRAVREAEKWLFACRRAREVGANQ